MDAILECAFKNKNNYIFSEKPYLKYPKKTQFLHETITLFLKQGQTRVKLIIQTSMNAWILNIGLYFFYTGNPYAWVERS